MKKVFIYIIAFVVPAILSGLISCNKDSDNPESGLPHCMEEKIRLTIGSQIFILSLFDNEAGRTFKELLPLTIQMEDVNSNEKFGRLNQNLPTTPVNPGTIHSGDLNLYGANGLVLFYKTFSTSYSYTRIGTVDNPSGLENVLGTGNVTITFAVHE